MIIYIYFVLIFQKVQIYIFSSEQSSTEDNVTDNLKSSQYLFNSYAKLIDKLFLTKVKLHFSKKNYE